MCVWWVRKHLSVVFVSFMIWTTRVFFQLTGRLRDRETAQASWFFSWPKGWDPSSSCLRGIESCRLGLRTI